MPDWVTHYYLPSRRPFQNLSDIDSDAVLEVMHDLNEMRRKGHHKRPFGRRYIEWRRLTEARLRELFMSAGGRPERLAPHYFCLGDSPWFAGLADGMLSVSLPLATLPPLQTSFTLVDSFSAMGFGPRFGYPPPAAKHHQVVYPLHELRDVVSRHVPTTEHRAPADSYVEIQLWTDEPLQLYLTRQG